MLLGVLGGLLGVLSVLRVLSMLLVLRVLGVLNMLRVLLLLLGVQALGLVCLVCLEALGVHVLCLEVLSLDLAHGERRGCVRGTGLTRKLRREALDLHLRVTRTTCQCRRAVLARVLGHLVRHGGRRAVRQHHTGLRTHRLVRSLCVLAVGRRGGRLRHGLVLLVLSIVHLLLMKWRRLAVETPLLIMGAR